MKLSKLLIIFIIMISLSMATSDAVDISLINAKAYTLVNAKTSQIILEQDSQSKYYPASITKLLTALVILDRHSLDEIVTITEEMIDYTGSHIALEPSEKLSVKDLLAAMLIASANDAAKSLAIYSAGSIESFASLMNEYSQNLGTKGSNFINPSGLHHPEHFITASDFAIISIKAYANDTIRELVNLRRYVIPANDVKTEPRYLNSEIALFEGMVGSLNTIVVDGKQRITAYPYANGMKKGYTDEASTTLVASATDGERHFIAILLYTTQQDMYKDAITLFEYAFNDTKKTVIQYSPEQTTIGKTAVNLITKTDIAFDSKIGDESNFSLTSEIYENLEFPIDLDTQVGILRLNNSDGQTVASFPLFSDIEISELPLLDDEIIYKKGQIKLIKFLPLISFFTLFISIWLVFILIEKSLKNKNAIHNRK